MDLTPLDMRDSTKMIKKTPKYPTGTMIEYIPVAHSVAWYWVRRSEAYGDAE